MTRNVSALVDELNALLRLTTTEAATGKARRTQAATDRVGREIATMADESDDFTGALTRAVRDLGAVPDVLGAAWARATAAARIAADQGQPLSEVLLADLTAAQQVLARARFVNMLAEQADVAPVVALAERLESAYTDRIAWLMTRLAEVAIGGPPALRPTPAQAVVGLTRRLAAYPSQQAARSVNRTVAAADDFQRRTGEAVTTNVRRARDLVAAGRDIFTAGRDASLERSEDIARDRRAGGTVRAVHRLRQDLGALEADELPIKNYPALPATEATARIGRLRDGDAVRAILAFETANKGRKSVVAAAQQRLEGLASELASA